MKPSAVKVYRKGDYKSAFYIAREAASRIIRANKSTAKLIAPGAWSVRVLALQSELMIVTWHA